LRKKPFFTAGPRCGAGIKAPAPAVATATPFGPRIHALAIYLKGFQALSYERLRFLFRDAFGLIVSEGALGPEDILTLARKMISKRGQAEPYSVSTVNFGGGPVQVGAAAGCARRSISLSRPR
jgi:hypothetical protein